MENATKALLIAGGVLIVILIIGVSMLIFNSGNDAISAGTDTTQAQAKQIYNGQFESFNGTQKGTAVKSLISKVITSNASNTSSGNSVEITTVNGSGAPTGWAKTKVTSSTDLSTIRNLVSDQHTYNVKLTYDDKGYVKTITINY